MKKETLVEKMARKAFESDKIQQSWKVHMQAFGPILEPAFAGNYPARIDLTAALNMISRRDLKGGLDKLKRLQDKCTCDADQAAWLFFMGVCMEMAGAKEQMITFYQQAGERGHRFYLPYLKVAKTAQMDLVLEVAEENYLEGIQCLKEGEQSNQTRTILGSAYANLSATLTMMHRFDDAFDAMEISRQYAERIPGRSGTVAITAAAAGDFTRAEEAMAELGKEAPQMLEHVTDVVEKIRTGTHSHFFTRPMAEEDISAFWSWFAGKEAVLTQMVRKEDHAGAVAMLQERLAPLFDFSEKGIELAVAGADDGIEVALADFYSVGLRGGYEQLLKACPGEVREHWKFEIVR